MLIPSLVVSTELSENLSDISEWFKRESLENSRLVTHSLIRYHKYTRGPT